MLSEKLLKTEFLHGLKLCPINYLQLKRRECAFTMEISGIQQLNQMTTGHLVIM